MIAVSRRLGVVSAARQNDVCLAVVAVSLDPIPTPWPIIAEVENFTLVAEVGPFNVTAWGQDHYFGATLSNTFVSRQALLHATNQSIGTATGTASIPKAGAWYAIVRYEAPYRFSAEFTLTPKQGAVKLTNLRQAQESENLGLWVFAAEPRNRRVQLVVVQVESAGALALT